MPVKNVKYTWLIRTTLFTLCFTCVKEISQESSFCITGIFFTKFYGFIHLENSGPPYFWYNLVTSLQMSWTLSCNEMLFNLVNIMAADALAPYVTRISAAMILTVLNM